MQLTFFNHNPARHFWAGLFPRPSLVGLGSGIQTNSVCVNWGKLVGGRVMTGLLGLTTRSIVGRSSQNLPKFVTEQAVS